MGAYATEQAITQGKKRPDRSPAQWGGPPPQTGCAPAPQRGVQASHPASIVEPGMQRPLHLIEREAQCLRIKPTVADVDQNQAGFQGAPFQDLDFARAERALTVIVKRQGPLLFLVHILISCIGFVEDRLKKTD